MRGRHSLFMLVAIAALGASTHAQPTLTLRVEGGGTDVFVREPFVVRLIVANFETADEPVFPNIPDCVVRGSGRPDQRVMQSFVNGRQYSEITRTYNYELTPQKLGTLEIPAITLTVDGRSLRTDPVTLTVRQGDADDLLIAEITCDEPRLFVGQQAVFTLNIWLKPARYASQTLSADSMVQCFRNARGNYGEFAADRTARPPQRRTRMASDGSNVVYYVWQLEATKVLDQPRRPPFDDIEVGCNYPTKFERDVFGDMRFTRERRLRAQPTILAPDVSPLPADGRPATFSGAVGVFQFDAAAKPTQVRVGDPIELTLMISGDGPLETLPPPSLASQAALAEGFKVPAEGLTGRNEGGRRVFTQFIRARSADVAEIPPLEFAYFDPRRGEYVVARSRSIPLAVKPSQQLSPEDVSGLPAPAAASDAPVAVDGLRGIEVSESALLRREATPALRDVIAAVAVPPAVALGAWGGWAAISAAGASSKRRRSLALEAARRRIAAAAQRDSIDAPGEVAAALAEYIAARVGVPIGRATGGSGVGELRSAGASADALARVESLIARCEQAAYGGGASELQLADEARECVALLDRERIG